MDFSDLVATKLKEIMKEKDVTTYKLQDLTGIYNSTISQFLTRKTRTIRLEILFIVCEALDTNLSEFFADKRFKNAEAHDWLKKKEK